MLGSLPIEIVREICSHLLDDCKGQRDQSDLASISLTCKKLFYCAQPLLWQNLHIMCDQADLHADDVLQNLQKLLLNANHPVFRYTKRIKIVVPYCIIITKSEFTDELDTTLGSLLARCSALQEVYVNFSMVDEPDSRFRRLLNSAFGHCNITTISLIGYMGARTNYSQLSSTIAQFTIGLIGNSLPFNLSLPQNLRRLHVGVDCRDEILADDPQWRFPPRLWETLDTFVLEVYGWMTLAKLVVQAVIGSVKAAGHTNLRKLGILLNVDDYRDETIYDILIRSSPNLKYLAIIASGLPASSNIAELAEMCPHLCELTICSYLHSGTWKWPDSPHDYAAAFSEFPFLRRLALNHDDLATFDSLGGTETSGKFSPDCTKEGAQRRKAFCLELAKCSPTLEEVAFCPFDQQKSRLRVDRSRRRKPEVIYVESGSKFFWETP